ncbi:helix-turn-helix domain-containing protein [Halospeciosus flavus]|uniref:Helix-turn-helix domain-containing protein n=1 Tax=Halospeciosus flavus TaxID=3032283 RepID=A0ABD5Z2N8_9EURY|nr:helix-turn-helix domain-containing protein [Halospeciosus flavus]
MSLIAEFRLESPGLVLYETRRAVPGVHLDVEQEVGTDPQRPLFFFWAEPADGSETILHGADATGGADPATDAATDALATFERALRVDPSVTDETLLNRLPERHLYRVQFSEELETVMYPEYVELGAELLALHGDADGWHTRMRFPDREVFARFRTVCADLGVAFDLQRVYGGSQANDDGADHGLTGRQREAVDAALRAGYFDVPRGTTLEAVAEELGISAQSASERLRRGVRTLARNALDDTQS